MDMNLLGPVCRATGHKKVNKFGICRRLISIATNRSFGDLKAEEAPRQPMGSKV
jgi:hypothetical protein